MPRISLIAADRVSLWSIRLTANHVHDLCAYVNNLSVEDTGTLPGKLAVRWPDMKAEEIYCAGHVEQPADSSASGILGHQLYSLDAPRLGSSLPLTLITLIVVFVMLTALLQAQHGY
jgi:hypothetical protein